MKKIKTILPILSTVFVFASTSCSGLGEWNEIGRSYEINYCLLIGQGDHNDSIARTSGTRNTFGTRADPKSPNENYCNPIVNEAFNFTKVEDLGLDEEVREKLAKVSFRVKESEHLEQRSTGGATWDAISANDTTTLWMNKHSYDYWTDTKGQGHRGQSITFFSSNNDGMAMGALGSIFYHKGVPIFGYDANDDALVSIYNGVLTGTVECNLPAQCSAVYMVIRNAIDYIKGTLDKEDILLRGFSADYPHDVYGYINEGEMTDYPHEMSFMSQNQSISLQKDAERKITVGNGGKRDIKDFVNIEKDGSIRAKTAVERLYHDEQGLGKASPSDNPLKLYLSYYSRTDTSMRGSVSKVFDALRDKNYLNIAKNGEGSYDWWGNGNDEVESLNDIDLKLSQTKDPSSHYDAFILNMVKPTSTQTYLDKIYDAYAQDVKVNGKNVKRVQEPVIFWNKQPADVSGNVDVKTLEEYSKEKFAYIYYIGMDAKQGGNEQGHMIARYLANHFVDKNK